jgi:hypothetical protein
MAILRSGILGRASGKVAGVVGSHWKDKSYVREYVIPSNPNTPAQQVQRVYMRSVVGFGKPLVGPVFNKYVDKFQKSMSGWNFYVSQNIKRFTGEEPFPTFQLVWGKLWGIIPLTCAKVTSVVTVTWTAASYGNNGLSTDKVYAAVIDLSTGIWYFPSAEVARSVGTIAVTVPSANPAAAFRVWIWSASYSLTSPTLLEMVSNSAFSAVTGT